MTAKKSGTKAFTAIWIFYVLIAFEIIYMISPFAIYYYSIYGKGLNFLNDRPITSWLTGFFLPHIAESSFPPFNVFKDIGWTLALAGFAAFCVAAAQIYYAKLARKQAVTGGIYNLIRHPQYVSLSICSLGLLLVWPRYIVLIMFISMLFAYYFLAKAEERECEEKFGRSYTDYKNRTHMFVPINLPSLKPLRLPESGVKRYSMIIVIYAAAAASSIGLAGQLKDYSIQKLYASYSANAATISLGKIEKDIFEKILEIALKDGNVQKRLASAGSNQSAKYLNYVLPSEWFFPDIPMRNAKNVREHYSPGNYDKKMYKILFMHAVLASKSEGVEGSRLILSTVRREPVVEVEVSLKESRVIRIEDPPQTVRWGDIPTPIF